MGKGFFFGTPAHGHMNPTLALTTELVRRGEEIHYFASEEFRPAIEQTGAVFRDYGEAVELPDMNRMRNIVHVAEFTAGVALAILDRVLEAVHAEPPDYILHDTVAVWGKVAAQHAGVSAVRTCPVFAVHQRKGTGAVRFDLELLRMTVAALPALWRTRRIERALQRRYGRPRDLADLMRNAEDLNLVFTSPMFQPNADCFDASYRFVGPQLAFRPQPEPFPFERLDGKRVILVSMGTVYNQQPAFYRACFEAFGGMPDTAVAMSVGCDTDPAGLGPAPDNVIVRQRVPQLALLERADLFVTHGGMNSATEGLYHETPLILVPQGADQLLVACRVEQLGAGVRLEGRRATPRRLRALAERCLDDAGMRANAARIAASFRACGGHEQAADLVLEYVRR